MSEQLKIRIDNYKSKALLVTIMLFMISLQNHGVFPWLVGFAISFIYFFLYKNKHYYTNIIALFFCIFLIALFSLKLFIIDFDIVHPVTFESYNNNVLFFLLLALFSYAVSVILKDANDISVFSSAIKNVASIHMLAFILQFFVVNVTGYYIDFIFPFTGEESRYLNYFSSIVDGVQQYRVTGLYVEPSTFVGAMFALITLRLVNNKFSYGWFELIGILCMALAFSTAGMALSLALMLLLLSQKTSTSFLKKIFKIIALFFILALMFIYFDFEKSYLKALGTYDIRLDLLLKPFWREGLGYYLGYGPFGMETELYNAATDNVDGRRVAAVHDVGTLVFLMLQFGIMGAIIYIGMLLPFRKIGYVLLIFLLFTLTKISVFHPIFIFLYIFLINNRRLYGR